MSQSQTEWPVELISRSVLTQAKLRPELELLGDTAE